MPDPDFDQIAFSLVQHIWGITELDQSGLLIETRAVAEQLRQVWNARGAADIAKIEPAVKYLTALGKPKEPPDVPAQIRSLDR